MSSFSYRSLIDLLLSALLLFPTLLPFLTGRQEFPSSTSFALQKLHGVFVLGVVFLAGFIHQHTSSRNLLESFLY